MMRVELRASCSQSPSRDFSGSLQAPTARSGSLDEPAQIVPLDANIAKSEGVVRAALNNL
jgi:hypothetical protein